VKRDGHTHTQYCLHGSGEETEAFVIRAIEKGFEMYSFTEHLPLPETFLKEFPYSSEIKRQLELRDNNLDNYIREMHDLKKKYKERIQLMVGFEMDYLPSEEAYLKCILKEYGKYLDDSLLSVHIIEGQGGFRCIDMNPEDFKEGLINCYSSYEGVQLAYYKTVKQALMADLGQYKPKRLGHFTLCNKFQHYFNQAGQTTEKIQKTVREILLYMKETGWSIDTNMAGLFKEYCKEAYPSPWIIMEARRLKIPLVYGSDSHAVDHVGRGYDEYLSFLNE